MVTAGLTRPHEQSYYAGSIRTLRSLLINASPISWSGLQSGEEVPALPEATVRPQRAGQRARLSAKDIFANGPDSTQDAQLPPAVDPKVGDNKANRARQLADRVLLYTGSARDPYDAEDQAEYPLYAVCPCNLPEQGQEEVVREVIATINDSASQPYMVVLFAAPSPSIPVGQLISYYRHLSTDVRRSIKRLWVVHASLVTRLCAASM